jgi:predicted HicB family RNase H-like nuclease
MPDNQSSVSKADSYEAIGEFWDSHDFTEFDDPSRPDATFEIQDTVRIEAELLAAIEKVAASNGVSSETLINVWLQEWLQSASAT